MSQYEQQIEHIESSVRDKQEKLEAKDQEVQDMQESVQRFKQMIEKLKEKNSLALDEKKNATAKIRELEDQIEAFSNAVGGGSAKVVHKESEVTSDTRQGALHLPPEWDPKCPGGCKLAWLYDLNFAHHHIEMPCATGNVRPD